MIILILTILLTFPVSEFANKVHCDEFGIIIESYLIINVIAILSSIIGFYHLIYYLYMVNEDDEILQNLPEMQFEDDYIEDQGVNSYSK